METEKPKNKKQAQKIVNKSKKLIQTDKDLERKFGSNFNHLIEDALQMIEENKEELFSQENKDVWKKNKKLFEDLSSEFLDYACKDRIDVFFRDLSNTFLPLVVHLNSTFFKDEEIERNIKATSVIIEGGATIEDSILALKLLIQRVKLFQEYEPPAFQLSEDYLKVLKDDIKKNKPPKTEC